MGYPRKRRRYPSPAPPVPPAREAVASRGETVTVQRFEDTPFEVHVQRVVPHEFPVLLDNMTGATTSAIQLIDALRTVGYRDPTGQKPGWGDFAWGDKNALGGADKLSDIDALFLHGWPEGATKARDLVRELECELPMADSTRRRRVVGKDGTDVIVEAWIDRDLDHLWSSRVKFQTQGHRIIQIGVSWGGNAGTSSDQLFWSGAAALVLTELLEAAGYGVEVHAYCLAAATYGYGRGRYSLLDVTVKPSDQPLAADTFAAVLAHAGTFRSYGIGSIGHVPWNMGAGMGTHVNIDVLAESLAAAGVIQPIELLLPSIYSKSRAVEAVRRALYDMGAVAK